MASYKSQKEAYLRRHNRGVRSPQPELVYEEPQVEKKPSGEGQKTFAQKRKENLLSRARGGRPREVDVAVTAVLFASKLRQRSKAENPPSTPQVFSPLSTPTPRDEGGLVPKKKERGEGEKTWKEKRKDAFLRTHSGTPPKEAEVAVAALAFASKLKARSAQNLFDVPSRAGSSSEPTDEVPEPREKTFAQKRKDALLRRQGIKGIREPEIAVSSVMFASKLKRLASQQDVPT